MIYDENKLVSACYFNPVGAADLNVSKSVSRRDRSDVYRFSFNDLQDIQDSNLTGLIANKEGVGSERYYRETADSSLSSYNHAASFHYKVRVKENVRSRNVNKEIRESFYTFCITCSLS
jgi:hypothetical protein